MQVSDQSSVNREAIFRTTINRIKSTLMWEDEDLISSFGFTQKDYNQYVNNQSSVTQSQLNRFAEKLNLDPLNILKGKVDYHTLCKQQGGDYSLPERYAQHRKSRIKTATNIFNFLDKNHPGYSNLIANKLQISWAALSNPTEQVNIRLIDDIYSLMGSFGFSEDHFVDCGAKGAKEYYLMPEFAAPLWKLNNPKDLYNEFFNEFIQYIDGTWEYTITKLTDKYFQIRSYTKESTQAIYKTKSFGCKEQCTHRMGFVIGLLEAALNRKILSFFESKCTHRGDDYCQFEFTY